MTGGTMASTMYKCAVVKQLTTTKDGLAMIKGSVSGKTQITMVK